jgi:hypothetical protein
LKIKISIPIELDGNGWQMQCAYTKPGEEKPHLLDGKFIFIILQVFRTVVQFYIYKIGINKSKGGGGGHPQIFHSFIYSCNARVKKTE